jgi:hypothetical protein
MQKTLKIQASLDNQEYELRAQIARSDEKKLAAVVRESILKSFLQPESEHAGRKALEDLFFFPPTPVPKSYKDWESRYHCYKKAERKLPS